jgi:RNase P subunit RPR2
MHKKELIGIVGNGASPYALISALMMASSRKLPKLTEEEKIKRAERKRLSSEERIRQATIIKNICPACEGKLVRGKKDKKNDYKRLWTCKDCGSSHTA